MGTPSVRVKLGKRLRGLRAKRRLTQEQAAELIGLSLRYYQKLESKDPRDTRIETLERIAKGFKLSLNELLKF